MFARIIGKKMENPHAPLSKDEERVSALMRQAANVAAKIAEYTKKCELIQNNQIKYRESAKAARAAKKDMECKRFLRLFKQTEQDHQRYSNMIAKLDSIQSLVDIYLSTSDFLSTVQDATTLIETFGMDADKAQTVMDKMQDLKELQEEIHEALGQDFEDEDYDDMLGELDAEIANEKTGSLPTVPKIEKMKEIRNNVVNKKNKQEDDDLSAMLASL